MKSARGYKKPSDFNLHAGARSVDNNRETVSSPSVSGHGDPSGQMDVDASVRGTEQGPNPQFIANEDLDRMCLAALLGMKLPEAKTRAGVIRKSSVPIDILSELTESQMVSSNRTSYTPGIMDEKAKLKKSTNPIDLETNVKRYAHPSQRPEVEPLRFDAPDEQVGRNIENTLDKEMDRRIQDAPAHRKKLPQKKTTAARKRKSPVPIDYLGELEDIQMESSNRISHSPSYMEKRSRVNNIDFSNDFEPNTKIFTHLFMRPKVEVFSFDAPKEEICSLNVGASCSAAVVNTKNNNLMTEGRPNEPDDGLAVHIRTVKQAKGDDGQMLPPAHFGDE